MSRAERGLFWDMAAFAWDSDEPGTVNLPLQDFAKLLGVSPKVLRKFLENFPKTFVKLSESFPKTFVKLDSTLNQFIQPKLAEQWANYKEISDKRRKAAESRYANAVHKDHSASASASASAFAPAPNTNTTQDQVVVEVAPETAAAVKSVFDILQTNPFGSRAFQEIFVAQSKNGAKSWVDVMEHTIQECRSRKVGIPGRFYKIKHVLEKLDAEQSFKRKPL
jgi:hypothetical protein